MKRPKNYPVALWQYYRHGHDTARETYKVGSQIFYYNTYTPRTFSSTIWRIVKFVFLRLHWKSIRFWWGVRDMAAFCLPEIPHGKCANCNRYVFGSHGAKTKFVATHSGLYCFRDECNPDLGKLAKAMTERLEARV